MSLNTLENPKTLNDSLPFEDEAVIDVKKILAKIINNWYLFAISALICLILAVLYANYAPRIWHTSSKILVQDEKNSTSSALNGSVGSDITSLFNVKSNANNELQILKSRSLMANVVNEMQLNVRTYQKDGFKSIEVSDDEAPFKVKIAYKADTLFSRKYNVKLLNKDEYEITNADDNVDIKARYNQPVNLHQYDLVLQPNFTKKAGRSYSVSVESVDAAIDDFSKEFTASLSDKQATTIDLTLDYPNPKKGEAILNTLMRQYLLTNLQNKVQIADSTIAFINREIDTVFTGLSGTEKQFQQYQEQNDIADITEQSKALVSSASTYYDKLNQASIQLDIVDNMEKILSNPHNKQVIPSSLVLTTTDQSFGQAINSYNELLLARDRASLSYTESNPIIQNYDIQIENSRVRLLRELGSYKSGLRTTQNQLKQQNGTLTGQLKKIPSKQRTYLDFQRQQQLKQQLYLFLLQKREETAISKTSTISSSRIVDYAKSEFKPYKPKKPIVYLIGLVLGLVLPGLYLFIKEVFNIRVNTKGDIEKNTTTPIIAEISHNAEGKNLVIANNSRSVISEQFRSFRTNLQYVLDTSKPNVLLFTSSMSGEGKSFLSLNLGSALALTGKKVLFMEMDLRKPKLSENLGIDNSNGFTNYIISKSNDVKSIVKPAWFNENCSIISSGPIPPNPSELLISQKLEQMIDTLKKDYDYIIIDCAPIGLVTDALLLEKFADITFYVVRQEYTYKSQLNIVNDLKHNKKVKHMYLIVNDIHAQKGGYAAYGQGYGYGYGYGDYTGEEKKRKSNWFRRS